MSNNFSSLSQDNRAGHLLFRSSCDFLLGVVRIEDLPPRDRVEICFAGRSNVGKSSLINALTGRKGIARTSNTPGRTQEINFFALGPSLYMVDLPGYGYARAPLPKVRQWQDLLKSYLCGRANLRRVYLLIDSRRGLTSADNEIIERLNISAVSFQVILTKTDKIKEIALQKMINEIQKHLSKHPAAFPDILVTSSEKNIGLHEVRTAIASLL